MFGSIFNTETAAELTLGSAALCTVVSLALGAVIALISRISSKKVTGTFSASLVLLPAIVQVVIMMVNGNLGAGVAVMGAFSLIRFRSAPGSAKDICELFFAMAIGLATGMGYLSFAACMTVVIGAVMLLTGLLCRAGEKTAVRELRVTIPEDLDYTQIFDDLFGKFTSACELVKVKTTNMGSTFELKYRIRLKKDANEKEFIDQLRCRNGNLTIQLGRPENSVEEL